MPGSPTPETSQASMEAQPADPPPLPASLPRGATASGTIPESLSIVLAVAMVPAAVYVATIGWSFFVQRGFVSASRDVVWMAPLSSAILSVVLLVPFWGAAPWLRCDLARRTAGWGSVFLLVVALLLPQTEVHRLAVAVLAAGVATVASRWLTSDRALRRLRVAGATLAGLLLLGGSATVAGAAWRARQALAAAPPAAQGAPNVLLIILDTVRASAMSLYGYGRETTPGIDRWAQAGVVFEHAIATAPWTLPSHASLFTGHYPGLLSTAFRTPLDGQHPTVAEVLAGAGYETVGFTGNLDYTAWDSGLARGFHHYTDFRRSFVQVLRSGWLGQAEVVKRLLHAREPWQVREALRRPALYVKPKAGGEWHTAPLLTDAVLAWDERRSGRPFFAFVNYFDAHEDYRPPPELRYRFAAKPEARDLYDAEILGVDQQLERLLRELARRGRLRNTLVILTSDHGEQFGEHKLRGHGNSLYPELIHVPLALRFDGVVPAGTRVPQFVSLRDIPATILELTGVARPAAMPGVSLASQWQAGGAPGAVSPSISELTQDSPPPSTDPLRRSQMVALVEDGHLLFRRNPRDIDELYAVPSDLAALHNLSTTAVGGARVAQMKDRLRALFTEDASRRQARSAER